MKTFPNYKAFWPFYVNQHKNRLNRNLHFLGTSLVLLCVVLAFCNLNLWFLVLAPFCGYGFAWLGHFYFEQNKPATFQYPLWSLMGDFQMFAFMCMGKMDREVKRMSVLVTESE